MTKINFGHRLARPAETEVFSESAHRDVAFLIYLDFHPIFGLNFKPRIHDEFREMFTGWRRWAT